MRSFCRCASVLGVLCPLLILFVACAPDAAYQQTTVEATTEVVERDHVSLDLGELAVSRKYYFPESRLERRLVELTSMQLADMISGYEVDGSSVSFVLLPITSQLGDIISGEDVIINIRLAYAENIEYFNANIIGASYDALSVNVEFDREVDFGKDYLSLPIYPVLDGVLNSSDSFGEYFVEGYDEFSQYIDLASKTVQKHSKLRFVHYGFDTARQMFESGELDVLQLPRTKSALLWADTLNTATIIKQPSRYVYMVGFGSAVDYGTRRFVAEAIGRSEFIDGYLAGFADMSGFPLGRVFSFSDNSEQQQKPDSLNYICFVDSEWSYSFSEYLTKALAVKDVALDVLYTDFQSMLSIAGSDESDYIYAFAWDLSAGTDISVLLGDGFSGTLLNADDEELYFAALPVIAIARPFDNIAVRGSEFLDLIGSEQ